MIKIIFTLFFKNFNLDYEFSVSFLMNHPSSFRYFLDCVFNLPQGSWLSHPLQKLNRDKKTNKKIKKTSYLIIININLFIRF